MLIEPYLCFNGRCEEAVELYRKALGAELEFSMRFSEAPEGACGGAPLPAGWNDKILHCSLQAGDSRIMMSDGNSAEPANFGGVSLSVSVKDAAQADRVFAALGDGGQVQMPLGETFFSPRFGMVADRFGVSWMVIVPTPM